MQDKIFLYKNIKINYTSQGKGSTIVLLHGFLENSTMWKDISVVLSKKNRIITIDLLGHGKTENLSYIHTMIDQAKMIKSVLDSLKLRKYYLIGHSLGGYIALAFAELFTINLKGICLMNSTTLADSLEKKKNRERAITMVKKNKNTFVKMAIPNLFTVESRKKHYQEVELIKQEALKTSLQGIIASLEGMKIRKDRSLILKNNFFKKMFIIGEKDPLLQQVDLISQVKNTNTKVIKFSSGHMSHIENRLELNFALKEFVKS
ncbi:MAG: alpha/beta fold hydrolase [Flavobacteriaceae bacterium]|nr:alpha/beta fold hydrolase [Flavobacteriaceae bacterium]